MCTDGETNFPIVKLIITPQVPISDTFLFYFFANLTYWLRDQAMILESVEIPMVNLRRLGGIQETFLLFVHNYGRTSSWQFSLSLIWYEIRLTSKMCDWLNTPKVDQSTSFMMPPKSRNYFGYTHQFLVWLTICLTISISRRINWKFLGTLSITRRVSNACPNACKHLESTYFVWKIKLSLIYTT